jgi:uncharacterized protein YfaP (DUF2135 family)
MEPFYIHHQSHQEYIYKMNGKIKNQYKENDDKSIQVNGESMPQKRKYR